MCPQVLHSQMVCNKGHTTLPHSSQYLLKYYSGKKLHQGYILNSFFIKINKAIQGQKYVLKKNLQQEDPLILNLSLYNAKQKTIFFLKRSLQLPAFFATFSLNQIFDSRYCKKNHITFGAIKSPDPVSSLQTNVFPLHKRFQ